MSLRFTDMVQNLLAYDIQWALVQWRNGKRVVINIRSVVRCKTNELKPWTLVTVNWNTKRRDAVIVATSSDRLSLQRMTVTKRFKFPRRRGPDEAGPSNMADEESESFSDSSTCQQSAVETESADSDEDRLPLNRLKTLIETRRRLIANRNSIKKVVKRINRPMRVVPRSAQPTNTSGTRNIEQPQQPANTSGTRNIEQAQQLANTSATRNIEQTQLPANTSGTRNIEQNLDDSNNNKRASRPIPDLIRIVKIEKNNNNQSTSSSRDLSSVDNMTTSLQNTTYVIEEENELPEPQGNNSGGSLQEDSSPGPSRPKEEDNQVNVSQFDQEDSSPGPSRRIVPMEEDSEVIVSQFDQDDSSPGSSRHTDPMEEDSQVNDSEFDRSDDNVLISNKFNKPLAEVINRIKAEEHESKASPSTSGRSMQNITNKMKRNQSFDIIDMTKENKKNKKKNKAKALENEREWIPIGTGQTLIHRDKFNKINWKSYTVATRGLLLATFSRRILATHSLTGKKSPAFQNKPAKKCLDPKIIGDVIYEVTEKFGITDNLVRSVITTKCADEAKMLKMRQNKKAKENEENIPPPPTEPVEPAAAENGK